MDLFQMARSVFSFFKKLRTCYIKHSLSVLFELPERSPSLAKRKIRNRLQIKILAMAGAFIFPFTVNAVTHHAGTIQGQFNVSPTGAATYSIPIEVPPGINGMQPKLSLEYNSNAGNGPLGVGWALGGLSKITRCPQTYARDGKIHGVDFTSEDRFCLDGQRLVAVSGLYGAPDTEYRTEIESYSKIISKGVAGNGPAFFIVQTKSGRTIEYGNTDDSRIEANIASTGVARSEALIWVINRVVGVSSNYMTFTYDEETSNGAYYIKRIDLTGSDSAPTFASVRFSYESRNDADDSYIGGSKQIKTQRLTDIKTFIGEKIIRDYLLNYKYISNTNRSALASINECDANSACKISSTFVWREGGDGNFTHWTNSSIRRGSTDQWTHYFADVNGDGMADWIQVHKTIDIGYVGLATGDGQAVVIGIKNGLGEDVSISYKPITDESVYTKYSNSLYPVRDIQN